MKPYDIYTLENYPLEAQDKPEEFDEYVIHIDTCVPFHLFSRPFSGVYMIRSSCSFGNLAGLQCHVSDKMLSLEDVGQNHALCTMSHPWLEDIVQGIYKYIFWGTTIDAGMTAAGC